MSDEQRPADQGSHANDGRVNDAGHSVLKNLEKTVDVPRVHLPDYRLDS